MTDAAPDPTGAARSLLDSLTDDAVSLTLHFADGDTEEVPITVVDIAATARLYNFDPTQGVTYPEHIFHMIWTARTRLGRETRPFPEFWEEVRPWQKRTSGFKG